MPAQSCARHRSSACVSSMSANSPPCWLARQTESTRQYMRSYALRRLIGIVPTLFVIVTLAFFVMRLAPGGPFDDEQAIPPEIAANLQAAYGLDQPLIVQFGRYVGHLLTGDLGPSF